MKSLIKLHTIIINDGLHDIERNKNPYGVARILLSKILDYRMHTQVYDEIEAGFTPSTNNYDCDRALYHASINGDMKLIKRFIYELADNWNKALEGAVIGGHDHLIKFFISKGANKFDSCLGYAILTKREDLIEFFISKGINSFADSIKTAALMNNKKLIERLVKLAEQSNDNTIWRYVLEGAAEGCHMDLIEYCIPHCVSIDYNYGLAGAAKYGSLSTIESFIARGANNWNFGLFGSICGNSINLIEYFLAKGASIEDGLFISAEQGSLYYVQYFISKGACRYEEALVYAKESAVIEVQQYLQKKKEEAEEREASHRRLLEIESALQFLLLMDGSNILRMN